MTEVEKVLRRKRAESAVLGDTITGARRRSAGFVAGPVCSETVVSVSLGGVVLVGLNTPE